MSTTGERFERVVAIMERLRAPGGCPWDREQTFDSIKPYTLEETYEVLEAIDNRDWDELTGELGDLLLQVLFYSEMAKEQGTFSIDDVLDRLSGKLVDRHPHVFGDVKADTSAEVKRNWEALKVEERKKRQQGISERGGGRFKSAKRRESAGRRRLNSRWHILENAVDARSFQAEFTRRANRLRLAECGGPVRQAPRRSRRIKRAAERISRARTTPPEPRGCRIGPPGRS